ncbi:MAG: LysM peptidoglycan-binding domain-containing protein [Geobacteraceae bacterium]|nr:LysM peptidoglycan-binding domain-containing protein [Geobacteraceae bacterium]
MIVRKINPETDALKQTGIVTLLLFLFPEPFLLCLLLFMTCSPAMAGKYLLYQPNPAESEVPPLPGEGVLVKKIIIKRGDTLSALSRQFSGKSSYFPQILLFNDIRNPNLIYAGQELFVPLSEPHVLQKPLRPNSDLSDKPGVRTSTRSKQGNSSKISGRNQVSSAERYLFDQAAAFFAQGKYREALEGFNGFLKQYPHSSLLPDASLYRGDCFLRLSGN